MYFLIKTLSLETLKINYLQKFDRSLQVISQFQLNWFLVGYFIVLVVFFYWLFFISIDYRKPFRFYGQTKIKHGRISRRKNSSTELPPPYPNGWYGILESSELKAGEFTYLSCLGEEFVIYRSQTKNNIFILDAYCPHMGANLGVDGRVVGDNIECSFHQWRFRGSDGICTSIPYSSSVPTGIKVKKWLSTEANGYIFVWYSKEEHETPWALPISIDNRQHSSTYHGRNEFYINCHIQEIPENGADFAHFRAIHSKSLFTGNLNKNSKLGIHIWDPSWDFSKDKHIAETKLNHTFKLFNKFNCFRLSIKGKQIGPAFVHLSLHSPLFGDFQIFQTVTPIEPLLQKVVHRFYASRLLAPIIKFLIFGESVMFARDIDIWNNKIYRNNPMFVQEDSSVKKFRKWYSQFYTVNSKSFQAADYVNW